MAVYIKKERLGSGPPPGRREAHTSGRYRPGLTQAIESLPGFKALQDAMAVEKAKAAEGMKEKWDSNAEVQRFRTLTPEEKAREAIDHMMPTAKAVATSRKGSEATHEEARAVAEGIANLSDRKKSEGEA